ncbi:helix-turn-helix transcriptional regulator [Enterococcus saccharolyticus]|uniref:helix-turn-helix domain-containing protein n=1 Tax=Enterococcus TaxID=1350 RepID=UPI001E336090|nr:helix-turn-helix domain-containing protein [Enterococcus saccharolyticus]MCD5002481.1 helix-turn-helix transcriptional regulator [Enterococcus saccharolyticus]
MNEQETFGETIKRIRKKQKMTQKMLAQGICAQSVLSRIENGMEIPNVMVLQAICQRLNVSLDQILHLESEDIQRIRELFSQVHSLLIHRDYPKMAVILEETELLDRLYLDTDFQLYYYYLGSCEFFLYQSNEAAIQSLKKGLSYTYTKDKINVAPVEIQIMSCLGRVYGDINYTKEAYDYLENSYRLTQSLPENLPQFELTKVFYNYSSFLFQMGDYKKALEVAKQGIHWAQQRASHYYLEELFLLCSQICQALNSEEEAAKYKDRSEMVIKIRKMV